jgi:hypothetical protein
MQAAVTEMRKRYAEMESAKVPYPQLTVILDEARNSVAESEELSDLFRQIISIGREAHVRLILLSTTDRVGPLGFNGEGDALDSMAEVRLGEFAARVQPDVVLTENKPWLSAAVYLNGAWVRFDNTRTAELLGKLELAKEKAWATREYNCQTGVAQPEVVVKTVPPSRVISSAQRGSTEAEALLEALLSGEVGVNGRTPPGAGVNHSQETLPDASEALEALPPVGELTNKLLVETYKSLLESGAKVTPVIRGVWGVSSGRAFSKYAVWLKVAQELKNRIAKSKDGK